MSQLKYILYSWLIAIGLAVTIFFFKTIAHSTIVATKQAEVDPPGCGFIPLYDESKITQHKGKVLFMANCATCHSVAKTLVGPALAHVEKRGPWTERKNLVKWVQHPESYLEKSAYAKALYKQYNQQIMPSFEHLTLEEINAIFDYINEVSLLTDRN